MPPPLYNTFAGIQGWTHFSFTTCCILIKMYRLYRQMIIYCLQDPYLFLIPYTMCIQNRVTANCVRKSLVCSMNQLICWTYKNIQSRLYGHMNMFIQIFIECEVRLHTTTGVKNVTKLCGKSSISTADIMHPIQKAPK